MVISTMTNPVLNALLEDVVATVTSVDQTINQLMATKSALLATASRIADDEPFDSVDSVEMAQRAVATEIGAALRLSDRTIESHMGVAARLHERFPATAASFSAGRVSQAHVRVIMDAGDSIEDAESRARYEEIVVARAETESPNRLRPFAAQTAERFRTQSFTERHQEAHERRATWVKRRDDGMSELVIFSSSVIINAMRDRATQMANAVKAENTRRAKEGGDVAESDAFDRILTHPVSGMALGVDRYRPSAEMRRYLRARDRRCRFPGCRLLARLCDDDHTIAHVHGGATTVANLADVCRRHHVTKHSTPWRVRQLGGGVLKWISPTGRTYIDRPPGVATHVTSEDVAERMPPETPPPF